MMDSSSIVGAVDPCPVVRHVTFFRRLARQSCQLLAIHSFSNPLWRRASLWALSVSDVGQLPSKGSRWRLVKLSSPQRLEGSSFPGYRLGVGVGAQMQCPSEPSGERGGGM